MKARCEIIGDATLYLGDCREIAGALPAGSAIVSDPPYGIAFQRSTGGARHTKHAAARGNRPIVGDDAPFDPSPWTAFDECILWGADHFYPRLPDSGRWLAWNKLGHKEPWDSFSDVEFAWHSGEGAARIFSMLWKGIATDNRGENNGQRDHPTQKPVRLMAWCIDMIASPIIVDPYMGSGTTGVAAIKLGRRFIGCEIDPAYFDVACRRIEEQWRQAPLPLESR